MRLRNDDKGLGNVVWVVVGGPLLIIFGIYLISAIASALLPAAPNEAAVEVIRNTENTGYLALALLSLAGGVALLFALLKR